MTIEVNYAGIVISAKKYTLTLCLQLHILFLLDGVCSLDNHALLCAAEFLELVQFYAFAV